MSSSTPLPQSDIDAWTTKYSAKGLPSDLLTAMIAEVELEWQAQIGFGQINRLAQLLISIVDYDTTPNCFYLVSIIQNMNVFQGEAITIQTYKFAQIPCIPLSAYVVKCKDSDNSPIAYGVASLNHSKDETLLIQLINITGLIQQFAPFSGIETTNLQDGIINLTEQLVIADTGLQIETSQPIENFYSSQFQVNPNNDVSQPTESLTVTNT